MLFYPPICDSQSTFISPCTNITTNNNKTQLLNIYLLNVKYTYLNKIGKKIDTIGDERRDKLRLLTRCLIFKDF